MFHFEEKKGRFVLWALMGGRSRKEEGEGCIQDVEKNWGYPLQWAKLAEGGSHSSVALLPLWIPPRPGSLIGCPCTGSQELRWGKLCTLFRRIYPCPSCWCIGWLVELYPTFGAPVLGFCHAGKVTRLVPSLMKTEKSWILLAKFRIK